MSGVKATAKYNEESGEVEICAVGNSVKGGSSIKANACATTELDLDSIVNTAAELRKAVESVLAEVEKAVERLDEAGVEYDPKLVEALAAKAVEGLEYSVTVKVEPAKRQGEA